MPRRNRVDPWGELHAVPTRGRWMGNRGLLHTDDGEIVRHHRGQRWIICRLHFKGRRRALMQPGRYTELFFIDEATALAAGHRPCAECRRADYNAFMAAFKRGNPSLAPQINGAGDLDAALHTARWADQHRLTHQARVDELPPGVFLHEPSDDASPSAALLCLAPDRTLRRWTVDGYQPGPVLDPITVVTVLTPLPTVNAIAAGYRPFE